jgi:hypothetical protein
VPTGRADDRDRGQRRWPDRAGTRSQVAPPSSWWYHRIRDARARTASPAPRRVAAGLALIALAAVAHADVVTYPSHGSAAATDADARTRALDAAFASAVTEAVADLAGKNARAQAAAVDREIVRRARRFVASFAVTTEHPGADRFEVDVDVRIDRDKVRTRLLELGVGLADAPPVEPGPPAIQPRAATLLYRVTGVAGCRPASAWPRPPTCPASTS